MKVYHVAVESSEGWYAAHALEDSSVITQGRTLDEVILNVREVVDLLYGEKAVQVELILPPDLLVRPADSRRVRKRA
jgi:predicted RNase H-like HicB family nuclease